MSKTTWTPIYTQGIFDGSYINGMSLDERLALAIIKDIERHKGKTSAVGFSPYDDPMGENFRRCAISGDKLWSWYVRIDRVSVPGTTVKIQAQKFVRDGLPGLSDAERKAYESMKGKKKKAYVEEKIRRKLIMDTPASNNLVKVYLDRTTGIIRVCSHKSSTAVRFVSEWLKTLSEVVKTSWDARHEPCPVDIKYAGKSPESMLIEKFDGNPLPLLEVIPGSFNCAVNDGDQMQINPRDEAGMRERLQHFKRDFLTWLSYRAVAGERISLPPASLERGACTVDVSVNDTCSIKIGSRAFVDVTGKDPVMDISTRAALKNGAKIARAHFGLTVGYANGSATKHNIDLGTDLMPYDVDLKSGTYRGEAGDDILKIADIVEQMADVEDILKRLFIFFAVLRAGARWSFEREAMMGHLYTLDNIPTVLEPQPVVRVRRAEPTELADQDVDDEVAADDDESPAQEGQFDVLRKSMKVVPDAPVVEAANGFMAACHNMAGVDFMTITTEHSEVTIDLRDDSIGDVNAFVDAGGQPNEAEQPDGEELYSEEQ